MNGHEHLPLPEFKSNLDRKKSGGGGGYALPEGRVKSEYSQRYIQKAQQISHDFSKLKATYQGSIDPNLIFELKVNDKVDSSTFQNELLKMGLDVLSIAEDKKGYWVVFASDEQLVEFRHRLDSHGKDGADGATKYDFFNAIDEIEDISNEKKIAPSLLANPVRDDEEAYLDVELWRMSDDQLNKFISQISTAIDGMRITDKLIRDSFALLRVKITKTAYDLLIEFKEIARISRPPLPTFNPFETFKQDIEELKVLSPSDTATGILIIDSGVVSGHPLIKNALGDEGNFQSIEDDVVDKVGHGTAVAGCALYGDIENCINTKEFHAQNWLFSAKLMYARTDFSGDLYSEYDRKKLMEHQFQDAIEYFLNNEDNRIKVVNVSLGNKCEVWHKSEFRQPPLASLIDELAREHSDVVFIVSAGNINPLEIFDDIADLKDNYPQFLYEQSRVDFNLINPATSALALTVGSLANSPRIAPNSSFGAERDIWVPLANEHQPSPFTRTGPGINGMIKPELVEYGGNIILGEQYGGVTENRGGNIAVLSNKYPDRLFSFDQGTSFSAPKVARTCALIANQFPERSSNFIKNLAIQSAGYLTKIDKEFWGATKKEDAFGRQLMALGYGLPNHNKAISSYNNRVIFFDENSIQIDQVKVFQIKLPENFFSHEGDRIISVALTYNPPVRRSRGDYYLGNTLEFKLFHSVSPEEVISRIAVIEDDTESSIENKYDLDLEPKVTLRSKGCHQKGVKVFSNHHWSKNPFSDLCLSLINKNRWIKGIDEEFLQDYCISVCVYHSAYSNLYAEIKSVNQVQIRERARVR